MDAGDDERQFPPDPRATRSRRGGRLAAALRTNLMKRKEQGRARARAAVGLPTDAEDRRAPASQRPVRPGGAELPPHDSAEIVAEKSADQAN